METIGSERIRIIYKGIIISLWIKGFHRLWGNKADIVDNRDLR